MRVIDLLNKIANGEMNEDTLIEFDNGYRDYCSVRIFFDRYIVDRENLNCEVEIIEDTPKEEVQVLSRWYPPKEEKKIEKFYIGTIVDDELQGLKKSINVCNEDIQDKINEIIDRLNGE